MSERSGPRANPLYGGPSAKSGSTAGPSWVKNRNSGFSDTGSPTGSPRSGRGPSGFYPGYVVETPGRSHAHGTSAVPGASPYRPPSYFVQTPAHSDHNGLMESPMSSAPSSPRQYGDGEQQFDARSVRSGGRQGGRYGDVVIDKVGDEIPEEDYYPDEYRDRMRRRRQWKVGMAICALITIGILVAAAITAWVMYQPAPVSYTFNVRLYVLSFFVKLNTDYGNGQRQ